MMSIMLERMVLAKVAIGIVARQKPGRIMWLTTSPMPLEMSPMPMTGRRFILTENWRTSIRASQKIGMDTPTSVMTMTM